MAPRIARSASLPRSSCSIERTLAVVGERWTFLILREALMNQKTRFADFEASLGVAPNILSDRLCTLVDEGLLEKQPYREEGSRQRYSYHPTAAGEELTLVLAALQQWGDDHLAPECGATVVRRGRLDGAPIRVGYLDDHDRMRMPHDVVFERTANHPALAAGPADV